MRNIFLILIVAISLVTLAGCKNNTDEKQVETEKIIITEEDRKFMSNTGRTSAELEGKQAEEKIPEQIKCEEVTIKDGVAICSYRVEKGDTQSKLAQKFGYSRDEFAGILKRDKKAYVYEGKKLKIPLKNNKNKESEEPERYYYPPKE